MQDASNAFTSQTNVSFVFKTQIEICLKIKRVCVLRLKRKRKIANVKIYEDKRDLYCICNYFPQFTWKGNMESVKKMLKIIHLTSRKSYPIIICLNSHELYQKLTSCLIFMKSYLVIIGTNSHVLWFFPQLQGLNNDLASIVLIKWYVTWPTYTYIEDSTRGNRMSRVWHTRHHEVTTTATTPTPTATTRSWLLIRWHL